MNWPDGGACGYCYQEAKRTRGTCVCGHDGILPGRIDGQPACRRCSGVKLNIDCKTCSTEDELYRGSRCWSCELAVLVDHLLINPDTDVMAAELAPVAAALKAMKRSNSGVTWIRQRHVTAFLKDLAVAPSITHEKLDELPGADRTRNYVRGLLVEHGALPRRDELAVRYDQWATIALERVSSNHHRDVVRRYIRWNLQRRMNQMEFVPHGTFLRSKQTVTVAIEFLNWLHAHGITVEELRQEHLDAWLADGPSTRRFVDRFIPWAIKAKLVDPELMIPRHRRGTSPKLHKFEQDAVVERVVHTDELSVRDRAAAILVIVFGQHIEHVVRLTWNDVTVTDDVVTIRLGKTEFALPSPLDEPMRQLAAAPGNDLTAAHTNSSWVFRGYSPGQHIHGASLRQRLKVVFSTRAARLGTLHELTKLGPVPVIADALGYHPSTIERHAIGSASTYAEYIAAARDQRRTS
ncbi:Fis family transcriptional regulator [Agromyces tropicus]|uniref:Fis family transcriptional regulator n=1 Tax=Agromyces tropicus TaxID=555371 RepID=UPI0031D4E241